MGAVYLLNKISVLDALPARHSPYWGPPIKPGKYIGYRKPATGWATWIARVRDDQGKQKFKSLGVATRTFNWEAAVAAAATFFGEFEEGVSSAAYTVADACRAYVEGLRADDRPDTASDADGKFRRTVYASRLGGTDIKRVRATAVKEWRRDVSGVWSTKNRVMAYLQAALNAAVTARKASPAAAIEWSGDSVPDLKPPAGKESPRSLILDIEQRRKLLEHCPPGFREFVLGVMLTGSRPMEIASAHVRQFEAQTESITLFTGKRKMRTVPLSPEAVVVFTEAARGKRPGAYLFERPAGERSHEDDAPRPWTRMEWSRMLIAVRSVAKLPEDLIFYTLRHTWITYQIMGGMTPLEAAKLTGTSLAQINKTYGHLHVGDARAKLAATKMT